MSSIRALLRSALGDAVDDQRVFGSDTGVYSGSGIYFGSGTPEGNFSAAPGSIFIRTDPSSAVGSGIYRKGFTSGTGATGWVSDQPPCFGSAFEFNESPGSAIVLTVAKTFYKWITGASATAAGTGLVTWNTTDKTLVVGANGGGTYMVSATGAGVMSAAHELEAVVFKNETETDSIRCDQDITNQTSYAPFAMTGLIALVPGDAISLRFASGSGSDTFTVRHAHMTIVRVGA